MKKIKIILFVILMISSGQLCIAQSVNAKVDSATVQNENSESVAKQTHMQSQSQNQNQNQKGNKGNQQENMGSVNGKKTVKQIKGAKPDMTKARGARPPKIVRPSGSGIPKGIGKPGGVMRRGGR
jgi:uncharacterized protein YxeA